MREYELTVIYDLAVAEGGGPDAAVQLLSSAVEARGGSVTKVDHWGRRRLAYPINRAIDGDYVVSRVELDPAAISPLEAALRIDERVYRHLIVRADELPQPRAPREPRVPAGEQAAPGAEAPGVQASEADALAAEAPAAEAASAESAAEPDPAVSPAGGATPPSAAEASEPEAAPAPVDETAAAVHAATEPATAAAPVPEGAAEVESETEPTA